MTDVEINTVLEATKNIGTAFSIRILRLFRLHLILRRLESAFS